MPLGRSERLAAPEFLVRLNPDEAKAKYKNVNSAQPIPGKAG